MSLLIEKAALFYLFPSMIARAVHPREPHWERGDNLFPRCVLILGMHETSNADWSDASVTWQLTPLSL